MYGWPRVLVRDSIVLFFAGLFTMIETDVPESAPPVRPPCGHTDWRQILSFLLALSVAIVLIEALNLSAFHINRKIRRSVDGNMAAGVDLLFPGGWFGLALGSFFLLLAFRLHGLSPCKPVNLGGSYVASALALGYGLVVVTAAGVDIVGNYSNRAKS
jgi:hypothetical protein